jgi:cytochrome c peroxidase
MPIHRNYPYRLHAFQTFRAFAMVVFASLACPGQTKAERTAFRFPTTIPQPANNRMTKDRVELGKMLFFDPRLSGSQTTSCASCHKPSLKWSDGLPTAIGQGNKVLRRSTPTLLNAAFNSLQMWDGRFHSLEEQVRGPIEEPTEMDGNMAAIVTMLNSKPGYVRKFALAYPEEGITPKTVTKAIASFERTIISKDTAFDEWINGDESAITPSAKRGFELFNGKARCMLCHQGSNFTDEGFHNIASRETRTWVVTSRSR